MTGNRATGRGGGVFIEDGYGTNRGAVTIEGSGAIRDNLSRAAENGAGISHCGATLTGVVALTNVLNNLAPNGPLGAPAADIQVWNRGGC